MSGRVYARAALVGTGHIGGSLLLALRRERRVERVVGYDRHAGRAERARERGIVDELAASAAEAARGAGLVVLATPVAATAEVAREIAGALAPGSLVLDVGSTKAGVVARVEQTLGGRFVGCHPIAGRERTGPDAAEAGLFAGCRVLLTPTAATEAAALDEARALWQAAGARVEEIDPLLHDRVLAVVSHLPHVAAFTLAAAVERVLAGDAEVGAAAAGLAGGGFMDTTRVAASDPVMWRDIFVENRDRLLPLMDALGEELATLRRAVAEGDGAAVVRLVERAGSGRARVLR